MNDDGVSTQVTTGIPVLHSDLSLYSFQGIHDFSNTFENQLLNKTKCAFSFKAFKSPPKALRYQICTHTCTHTLLLNTQKDKSFSTFRRNHTIIFINKRPINLQ